MNYTSNYNLNLPEPRDQVEIGKLNENFTTLDSAVKAVDNRVTSTNSSISSVQSSINNVSTQRKPVVGTYTGDGSATRTISLGFQPSVIIVMSLRDGIYSESCCIGTSQTPGQSAHGYLVSAASSGFTVYYVSTHRLTNMSGITYLYAAWR